MTKDCRDTALRYLERRARTAYEVKSHLLSKGFSEEEAEKALRYLQEFGYVDDPEYCREYIRYGMNKGRGPLRLQSELAEKGIGAAMIRDALEERFDRQAEKDAALREADKILNAYGFGTRQAKLKNDMSVADEDGPALKPDEKTAAKIGRKLASLGYHTEIIYEIVGQVMKSRETD